MNSYDYPRAIKKARPRRPPLKRTYKINEPANENLLIGNIALGTTLNILPVTLDRSNGNIERHDANDVFEITTQTDKIVIKIEIDSPFILGLLQSGKFCFKFTQTNEDVSVGIYFKSLPIKESTKSFRIVLTKLFKLLYSVGDDNPASENPAKRIDNLDNVSDAYAAIRTKQQALGDIADTTGLEQCKWLKPKLRPYQQQAVQWMLKKEASAGVKKEIAHPSYVRIKLPSTTVYFDPHLGNVLLELPIVSVSTTGGILADEMGLGKTIELLALVLSHLPRSEQSGTNVQITRQRKRPNYEVHSDEPALTCLAIHNDSKNITRDALQLFYEKNVYSVYEEKRAEKPAVACICGSQQQAHLVECADCHKKQHANCMGYTRDCGMYRCPQCWSTQDLLVSEGTLIVCPTSLRQQWLNEIEKHVAYQLKVLNYEGSNILTPMYPTKLASYDIVVTTYSVLQTELRFVDQNGDGGMTSLRHQRKYSSPGSPITFVKWKRLCLDEAQTVESTASMVAAMAQRLNANYRWAITGTPISVSISDVYGLIEYLQLTPYNDRITFNNVLYNKYLDGEQEPLIDFLATVLWRTAKDDVLEQINIPRQRVEHYYVDFTQVEQYFYDCETNESRKSFLEKLDKYDLSAPLVLLRKDELNNLLLPVLSLRRVCVHHNVVKGRYLLTKKPVNSMQELLDALIARNMNEAEDHLRLSIAALNGLAGAYLLLRNSLAAAEHYIKIRQLESRFTAGDNAQIIKLTVDKLPLIHMYYNLRQLLIVDKHLPENLSVQMKEKIEFTVEELNASEERLENDYIQRFQNDTKEVIEGLNELTEKIYVLEQSMTHETWYADVVAMMFQKRLHHQLSNRIESMLQNYVKSDFRPEQSFIITKLMSWISSLSTAREMTMGAVNDLFDVVDGNRIVFSPQLLEEVVDCHLRPDQPSAQENTEKCRLCQSNKLLRDYEKILFDKETEHANKQFAWKPTEEYLILKAILKLAKSRLRSEKEAIRNGEIFMEIVELQKKEFKELRKEWTHLDAQICASDELALCKMRLKMKQEELNNGPKVSRSLQQLSYELRNGMAGINEIAEHEVDACRFNLQHEWRLNEARLEKCIGTNNYLQSLHNRENSGQQLDPCPICRCQLEISWNLLRCGHAYCINCLQTIIGRNKSKNQKISCAICRQTNAINDISYVDKSLKTKSKAETTEVRGNCSSKVEHIVRLIKRLKREDASVKVLVFSQWPSVLKVFRDIFYQNKITSELLVSGRKVVKIVENFKSRRKNITVLLLPINLGSKGLNLIEATHVIFAEPILDPAEEQQAIGRVHRIGQEKPTVIHRFIMNGSIEAEIHRVTTAKDKSKWRRTEVTLQQLKDLLFASNDAIADEIPSETFEQLPGNSAANEAPASSQTTRRPAIRTRLADAGSDNDSETEYSDDDYETEHSDDDDETEYSDSDSEM